MKIIFRLLIVAVAFSALAFTNPKKNDPKQIHVVIDAGHGGKDHGATFGGFTEKQIVAQISNKIKKQNQNTNVTIDFTRTDDSFTTLEQRTEFINQAKPDLVLSLHVNQVLNNFTASGLRLYIAKENSNNDRSAAFAEKFMDLFTKNHDVKAGKLQNAPFYILKNTEVPAIVVELGFLSNDNDRKWLTDDMEQDRIAQTILQFIGEIK